MNEKKIGLRMRRPELEPSLPTPTPNHHYSIAFLLAGTLFPGLQNSNHNAFSFYFVAATIRSG